MDDDQRAKIEAEIDATDAHLRSIQAEIDKGHIALCATANVILELLRDRVSRTKSVVMELGQIDASWARLAAQRLQEAVAEAQLKRGDREANLLFSLPQNTEESHMEWVREMRLGDTNSGSLAAACRYANERLRALSIATEAVASDLSAINEPQALPFVSRLR